MSTRGFYATLGLGMLLGSASFTASFTVSSSLAQEARRSPFAEGRKLPAELSDLLRVTDGGRPASGPRTAVPAAADQAKTLVKIEEVFGHPKSSAERAKLSRELFVAGSNEKDAATRYILFCYAGSLALEAKDLKGALKAVDRLERDFDVDALTMRAGVLNRLLGRDTAADVLAAARQAYGEAIRRDHYAAATRLGGVAYAAARRLGRRERLDELKAWAQRLGELKKAFAAIRPAIATLQETPGDLDANRRLGEYLCFSKGDLRRGLPLLARGTHELAQLDLSAPKEPHAQRRVGDGWWELASTHNGQVRTVLQQHAAGWYRRALPRLTGPSKVQVQKRIDKVAKPAARPKKKPEERKRNKAIPDQLDGAVGKLVNVELTADAYYRDIKLLDVTRNTRTGQWKAMKLEIGPSPFDMLAEKKFIRVSYRKTHRVLGDDGKPLFESRKAQQESQQRIAWHERLAAGRILPWPHLTRAEHEQALADRRKFVKKVGATFESLRLYESNYFLFATDIPAGQIIPYVKALDAMHVSMCKMYQIKRGTPVWQGKAVVVAFSRQVDFVAFEKTFMGYSAEDGVQGVCNLRGDGTVTIGCFTRGRPAVFAYVLVHETSHGFNHRFQTRVHLPSWINEGIAETVGELMVPASKSVKLKESKAIDILKQIPRVGDKFFASHGNIDRSQYGVASSLTKFLIERDPLSFGAFIKGIKEGMTAEESLRQHYGMNYDELLTAYGRSIGAPNLRR